MFRIARVRLSVWVTKPAFLLNFHTAQRHDTIRTRTWHVSQLKSTRLFFPSSILFFLESFEVTTINIYVFPSRHLVWRCLVTWHMRFYNWNVLLEGNRKTKKNNNTRTVTVTWLWLLFTLCIVCSWVIQNVSKISHINDIVRVMLFYSVFHLSSQNGFQL